jgi:hypothetical protein
MEAALKPQVLSTLDQIAGLYKRLGKLQDAQITLISKWIDQGAKFDGKDHPDPRTPGKDQTLAHWHLAPDLIVRQQKTDGKTSEWVIYTVSADGNTFTSISWAPNRPDLQDVQVFTRGK